MGMLYYSCKNCGGAFGIQAQFIGNVKCCNCNKLIEKKGKGVPRFEYWEYECKGCNLIISFEAIQSTNVSCVKCNQVMIQRLPVIRKTKRREKS